MNNFICYSTLFFWKKLNTMRVITAYFIILLNLANSKGDIQLHAYNKQMMNCNEKTVLQCNISSSTHFNIIKIYWTKHEERSFECDPTSNNIIPGFQCNYTKETLTLTILHPKPANRGRYFCIIQTDSGHNSKEINVNLGGECTGDFSWQMESKQLQCAFNGIYPEGTINWFHYDNNVTFKSTSTSLNNIDGTFNITSVLKLQDNKHSFNCSLWLLRNGQYFKKQVFEVTANVRAKLRGESGRVGTLHCSPWTLLLTGLMFSLRTVVFP